VKARERCRTGSQVFSTQEFAVDKDPRHEAIVRRSNKVASTGFQDRHRARSRVVPIQTRCRCAEPKLHRLAFLAESEVPVELVARKGGDPLDIDLLEIVHPDPRKQGHRSTTP
jgi:hypothetical protein